MNVIILGYTFGFPNGTGATARVVSYATGLHAAGARVYVLCLKPTELSDTEMINTEAFGCFHGISFAYPCGTSRRRKSRLGNAVLYLKGLWNTLRQVHRLRCNHQDTVMLAFLCDDPLYLAYLWFVSRWTGAILIGERNEFPLVYKENYVRTRIIAWLNDHWLYPRLDGIIVISKLLEHHFADIVKQRLPILRVPILVDCYRFPPRLGQDAKSAKLVAYCGNFDHDQEVESVIKVFSIATKNNVSWTLLLIGYGARERMAEIRKIVLENGINQRVRLTGQVVASLVPKLLSGASILVLPRALGKFSQAGFPTKLGEYLATGNPVVVTATGDIPDYLTDGNNAYLVHDDKVETFAQKLQYVINHLDAAQIVGRRGRETAEENFEVNTHVKRMLEYFEQIACRKK